MIWKIGLWALVAYYGGEFLNALFEPVEGWQTAVVYALPFALLGVLTQKFGASRRWWKSWFDPRLYLQPHAKYSRLTFWGLPLGSPQEIDPKATRRGDSLLPYLLTSPRTGRTQGVKDAYLHLWELDGRPVGGNFISKSVTFTKQGGKFLATCLLLFLSSLRAAGKIALFAACCVAGVWYFLPNKAQLEQITGNVQLKLRKSGENIEFIDAVNDLYVPLKRLPPALPLLLMTQEDRRFYSHYGVDPIGFGRALVQQGKAKLFRLLGMRGGSSQGGSGLTQQLAKNLFLSPSGGLLRKFREAVFAFKLEWYYDKDTILELYLNKIYFGPTNQIYGIEAAARAAFKKRAIDLNPYEAALLVQAIPNCAAILRS